MSESRVDLPDAVLTQYDLGQVYDTRPVRGGWVGESTAVTCSRGRYFMKRRESGCTPATIQCDHALVRFLVERGFPTPALLCARSGSTWVGWQGRIYEAYEWVDGQGFAAGDERQMVSLGQVVAQYHRLVADFQPPACKYPPWGHASVSAFLDLEGYAGQRLAALAAAGRIDEVEAPALEATFVRPIVQQLGAQGVALRDETGLVLLTVHGALEPGNVLFDRSGAVRVLLDWADSGRFVRAYDVAYALLKFAGRRTDAALPGQVGPALDRRGVECFAAAYRQEVHLTEAERALLPWLMAACRVVDALWADDLYYQDHRLELRLAHELWGWLQEHAAFLEEVLG